MNPVFVVDLESARWVFVHQAISEVIAVDEKRGVVKRVTSVQEAFDFYNDTKAFVVVPRSELEVVHHWAKETCNALGEACDPMDADALTVLEKWSRS